MMRTKLLYRHPNRDKNENKLREERWKERASDTHLHDIMLVEVIRLVISIQLHVNLRYYHTKYDLRAGTCAHNGQHCRQ